jgi:hypothetical protein
MAWEGGCEWYHSIGLEILYISADFKKLFKGPRPFKKLKDPGPLKNKKMFLSGKTTPQGASLNQGVCGVKNR